MLNTPHHTAIKTSQLLAALPMGEWQRAEPDLDYVELSQGKMLYEAGTILQNVYFPTTAIVSLVSGMQDGASAEVAVVGNEGVVGVCAFMGGGPSLSGALVQTGGHAWRMRAAHLAGHAARSEAVMLPLLRYTQALFAQLAQTSACHRHHSLDQQLCRWLLLHDDRHAGDDMRVTHERMAGMLGVRRETVTAGAMKLQQAGLIRYSRGCISILDRAGLQARSCECYGVVKSAYDRLSAQAPAPPLHIEARQRLWPVPAHGSPPLHHLARHASGMYSSA